MQTTTHLRGLGLQNALVIRAAALPPISTSVVDLTGVCVRDDWDIDEACAVIDADPMLLGALIREANSAVFAAASLVETSRDAVVRLGAARIMSIAIEMGLERLLGNVREYGHAAMVVFRHSSVTSIAAEVIKVKAPVRIPQAFAASALLHDIGEIILAHYLDRTGGPSLVSIRERSLDVVEAEREALDLDHCDVTAIVCRQWKMPEVIVEAVHRHHTPWLRDEPLASAVSLADHVADAIADPSGLDALAGSAAVHRCLTDLELQHASLGDLVTATKSRMDKYGRSY